MTEGKSREMLKVNSTSLNSTPMTVSLSPVNITTGLATNKISKYQRLHSLKHLLCTRTLNEADLFIIVLSLGTLLATHVY